MVHLIYTSWLVDVPYIQTNPRFWETRMPVVSCPFCFAEFRLPSAKPGQTAQCSGCGNAWILDHVALGQETTATGPDAFAFDQPEPSSNRSRSRSDVSHCLGCGRQLRNQVRCGQCKHVFCSEVCIRRHFKMTGHTTGGCAGSIILIFTILGSSVAIIISIVG
jgi:hypothetical protein